MRRQGHPPSSLVRDLRHTRSGPGIARHDPRRDGNTDVIAGRPRVGPAFLDALSAAARARLLEVSNEFTAPAGATIFPPRTEWTRVGVILEGVARASLMAADGRKLTVRYVRAGGSIGSIFPISGDRAPLVIEAVTDCRVLEFDPDELRWAAESDAEVGFALLEVLSRRLEDLYATLAANAFGAVQERLAGHLLELAHHDPVSGALVVIATHQDLAEAIGSVREVVTRGLGELRAAGLIASGAGRIEIREPGALAARVGRWRLGGG